MAIQQRAGRILREPRHESVSPQEMEGRARSILDISSDAILATNAECDILWANKASTDLFGYAPGNFETLNVASLISSPYSLQEMDGARCLFGRATSVPRPSPIGAWALAADGRQIPVEVIVKEVAFDAKHRFIAFIRDVSERRNLEQEVLRVSEMERQNIGRDIHDHLASKFSGIALMGRGLINRLPTDPVDSESLEYIIEQARAGATSARALARGLNPVALENFGLKSALTELRHEVLIMSCLSCSLEAPEDIAGLEPAYAAQLYRIAHEAVTNAMKHAEASHLSITVRCEPSELILQVADDGKGLGRNGDVPDGMGLHIMDYRARMLQGHIQIESNLNAGTCVTCRIPLSSSHIDQPSQTDVPKQLLRLAPCPIPYSS